MKLVKKRVGEKIPLIAGSACVIQTDFGSSDGSIICVFSWTATASRFATRHISH